MSSKDILHLKKTASINQMAVSETKGYESVPTKTPNRSEYQVQKIMGKTSNKHKSIIIQAPASVKPDGSTSDAATESPSKHRKIIRGFQQSKSTKVLAPNTV